LDITITQELENEGYAREFVNRIQNIRKDSGFELTDKIMVKVVENERLQPSIIQYKEYICAEILAESLEFVSSVDGGSHIEVNEHPITVLVNRKN